MLEWEIKVLEMRNEGMMVSNISRKLKISRFRIEKLLSNNGFQKNKREKSSPNNAVTKKSKTLTPKRKIVLKPICDDDLNLNDSSESEDTHIKLGKGGSKERIETLEDIENCIMVGDEAPTMCDLLL